MFKRILAMFIILLLCLSLMACGKKETGGEDIGEPENTDKDLVEDDGIRKDEEGLVEVHFTEDTATVYFDSSLWLELFQPSEWGFNDFLGERGVEIIGLEKKIVDVKIVRLEEYDRMRIVEDIIPTIFLLMEDGTVDIVIADLYMVDYYQLEDLYIHDKLPLVKDLVSLSLEENQYGERVLYGIDSRDRKYDLNLVGDFIDVCDGMDAWISPTYIPDPYDKDDYLMVLGFSEDGQLAYQRGFPDEGDPFKYIGTYELNIQVDGPKPLGSLSIDLKADPASSLIFSHERIKGEFHFKRYDGLEIEIEHLDGDYLYDDDYNQFHVIHFYYGYNLFSTYNYGEASLDSKDDYVFWLKENLLKVKKMVEEMGMAIEVTDEYEDLGDGEYRYVWLGTNHKEKFTREILYGISQDGTILEYDPLGDGWNIVFMKDN